MAATGVTVAGGTMTMGDVGAAAPVIVVHTALRRELRLAGGLVRAVATHDTERAAIVVAHLDLVLRGLEHHHTLEDDHVWPRLRHRVTGDDLAVVAHMEQQHAVIAALLHRVATTLPTWAPSPGPATGDGLADLLDELSALLGEHLDEEERHLLPLATAHLTEDEWEDIGRRAEEGNRREERAVIFGMLQYEGDPAVMKAMLRPAPLPARVLVPRLARRAYRRHALAVHGTATP